MISVVDCNFLHYKDIVLASAAINSNILQLCFLMDVSACLFLQYQNSPVKC
jgi:hypothetical protein